VSTSGAKIWTRNSAVRKVRAAIQARWDGFLLRSQKMIAASDSAAQAKAYPALVEISISQ